ncbi:MAG: hypothetical protein Q4G04_04250 [bacterium]|nr:hypothetical protein [bacterium]
MKKLKKYLNDDTRYIILIFLLVAIISTLPFLSISSMASGHNLTFQLSRISALKENLALFPLLKLMPNYLNNYGYAAGIFSPQLFLLIPATLNVIGINLLNSYKIFMIIINFFTLVTMYIATKGITKNHKASLLLSVIYLVIPYRMIDAYIKFALDEILSFVFLPLAILGLYYLIFNNEKKYYYLVLGLSGLILSHIISAYITIIIFIIILIFNYKKLTKNKLYYLAQSIIITFCLTAYFTVPLLEQILTTKYSLNITTNDSNIVETTITLWNLVIAIPFTKFISFKYNSWLFGGIGITFIIILIICFIKNKRSITNKYFIKSIAITSIACLLLVTLIFPWRLYIIPISILLLIGIYTVYQITNKEKIKKQSFYNLSWVTLFLFFIISISIFKVLNTTNIDIKYHPIGVKDKDIIQRGETIVANNNITYDFYRENNQIIINFDNNIYSSTTLELPLLYYKGYSAFIDEKALKVSKSQDGYVLINLNKYEEGTIKVKYDYTILTIISMGISIFTQLVFIGNLFKKNKYYSHLVNLNKVNQ